MKKVDRQGTTIISLILPFNLILLCVLFSATIKAAERIDLTKVQLYNLGVKLDKLQNSDQAPLLTAPANVIIPPDQEYIVSTAQEGLIKKLWVVIGDEVEKNQLLAEINSPQLLSLQRTYLKAHNDRKLIWSTYQRDKKLHDDGVIANSRWEVTLARYKNIIAEINETRQLLEIAGMSPRAIKKLADKRQLTSVLQLRAPFKGTILQRMVVTGERVERFAAIYRLANLEQLWLQIQVPQEYIHNIKIGDLVQIEHSSSQAEIFRIGRHVNTENQTVFIRAVITEQESLLQAGQSLNISIVQRHDTPLFKVADTAIVQFQGKHYIFVRSESGFTIEPVLIVGKTPDHAIIRGNLKAGQEITIRGAAALKARWIEANEHEM